MRFEGWREEKRESSSHPKGKRESPAPKREKGKGRNLFCYPIPLGNQTAHTHAGTHGTTRNDFPVGLTHPDSDGLSMDDP